MRRTIILAITFTLVAGTALADTLDGRLGFTGKAGAYIPLHDNFISGGSGSKPGLVAGGGLIYGQPLPCTCTNVKMGVQNFVFYNLVM